MDLDDTEGKFIYLYFMNKAKNYKLLVVRNDVMRWLLLCTVRDMSR